MRSTGQPWIISNVGSVWQITSKQAWDTPSTLGNSQHFCEPSSCHLLLYAENISQVCPHSYQYHTVLSHWKYTFFHCTLWWFFPQSLCMVLREFMLLGAQRVFFWADLLGILYIGEQGSPSGMVLHGHTTVVHKLWCNTKPPPLLYSWYWICKLLSKFFH